MEADLQRLQRRLAPRVELSEPGYEPPPDALILALDVQYTGDTGRVAGAVHRGSGELEAVYTGTCLVRTPYVPGLFCFREGPPLLALVEALRQRGVLPDLLVVDGHGLAHPRRFGVACWLGLAANLPTVGCAKETLLQWKGDLDSERGSALPVQLSDQTVGWVLRTQSGINPVFVSPGHLVGIEAARQRVLDLPGACRVPDPIRNADHAARHGTNAVDLGVLPRVPPDWES